MDYPKRDDLLNGKFTDGDPVNNIPASRDNAAQMNAVYDEIRAAIQAGGLTPNADDLTQLSASIRKQTRSKQGFSVSGDANAIVLTSVDGKPKVTELEDFDEVQFMVSATNTAEVTIKVDGLAAMPLVGVILDTQIFETALLTVRYIAGSFYIANQINPKTGNPVALIGEIISSPFAHAGACKMRFDGGELSRATHPILFAKAQKTGLIDQALKDADLKMYGGKWGDGDGTTTFTVPIYDGAFLRYADNGRGLDVGRELGGWQGDAIRNITGNLPIDLPDDKTEGVFRANTQGGLFFDGVIYTQDGSTFDASRVVPVAADNRPMNYAVNAEFLV